MQECPVAGAPRGRKCLRRATRRRPHATLYKLLKTGLLSIKPPNCHSVFIAVLKRYQSILLQK